MKTLIFSDLHLNNWKYGARIDPYTQLNTRLIVQINFLRFLHNYCEENDINKIVFCGDLFHTHGKLDVEVINAAITGFSALSLPSKRDCYALVGNHDMKTKDGKINALGIFEELDWKIVQSPYIHGDSAFFPYTSDRGVFDGYIKNIEKAQSKYVFMHQGVQSVPVGSGFEIPNEFLTPKSIPESVKFLFTGHYHRHQQVSDNLIVIGSPMQHTWSDAGEDRGFIILDEGEGTWAFHSYDGPKFISLEKNDPALLYVSGNYLRINTSYDQAYKQMLLACAAASVEFRPPESTQQKTDLEQKSDLTINDAISHFEKEKALTKKEKEVGKRLRTYEYS